MILFIPDIQTSSDLINLFRDFVKAAYSVSKAFLTLKGLEYGFKKCTGLSKWSGGFLSDLYADLYVSFFHNLEVSHLRLFYAKHHVILCSQWVYLNRPTTQHLRDLISSVVRLTTEIETATEDEAMVAEVYYLDDIAERLNTVFVIPDDSERGLFDLPSLAPIQASDFPLDRPIRLGFDPIPTPRDSIHHPTIRSIRLGFNPISTPSRMRTTLNPLGQRHQGRSDRAMLRN